MVEPNSETATRQSWPNAQPLPQQRALLPLERSFTGEDYELIRHGLVPEAMENKWFIFLEEDVLYFHRSWTGFCIYQVRLQKEDAQYRVVEAFANRDSTQYSSTNELYDASLLTYLIDCFLLQRPSKLPIPSGVSPGMETGLYHHHVAGVRPASHEPITPSDAGRWLWAWLKWLIRG